MDSGITSTGNSPSARETRYTPYAPRTEEEKQVCEAGDMPDLNAMSPEELSAYQAYMNNTLGAIYRLKHPDNLPDLHQMAGRSSESREEGSEHRTVEGQGAESNHGGEQVEGEHGGASTTFVRATHGAEYTHTGIEHGVEASRVSRGAEAAEIAEAAAQRAKYIAAARASLETGVAGVQNPTAQAPVATPAPASTATPPPSASSAAPPPTASPEPPSIPLKEPISEDMRLYVEAVRKAGGGTQGTAESSAATQAPRLPLKEPVTEDMRLYVEAVRNQEGASSASALPKTGTGTPPASTTPSGAPAEGAVGAGEGAGGRAATELAEEGAQHGGKLHSVMRTANKVLGPAAMLAGGLETAHGINELREGKTVDGSLDVTAGLAGVTSGAATTATAFTSATTVAGVGLGALAAGAGGVVAVADGVKDIYHGIKDGDTEKGVVGGIKTAAGAAMIAGACTGNPILVAGGAVTYVGAVVYENREAIADGAKKAYHYAADGVDKGVKATKEFAGNVAHKVSEKAAAIKEGTGKLIDSGVKKAGELKDAAVQKAGEIKDAVSKKAGEIKESVGNALTSAGDGLSNAADKVGGGLKSAWNWATSW
jgi:hypothetical protein